MKEVTFYRTDRQTIILINKLERWPVLPCIGDRVELDGFLWTVVDRTFRPEARYDNFVDIVLDKA